MQEIQDENVQESESDSLVPRASQSISSLNQSRELIVQNPNGSYCHAVLAKVQAEEEQKNQLGQNAYPTDRILYVVDDDEIALYSGFYDLPTSIDDFLNLYLRHQRYFVMFLLLFLAVEVALEILAFFNRDRASEQLMRAYRAGDIEGAKRVYLGALIAEIVYMAVYYIIGLIATFKRSVKLYSWFATLSLAGLLFELTLAYTNRFDILVFLFRFVGFVYSRFINQLLVSLLLLPR